MVTCILSVPVEDDSAFYVLAEAETIERRTKRTAVGT
jgi:hypothetical protein